MSSADYDSILDRLVLGDSIHFAALKEVARAANRYEYQTPREEEPQAERDLILALDHLEALLT